MASASSKLIDAVIREGAAPLLREAGFKKKARSFCKDVGDLIHVVNFQSSRFNDPDSASFTINLNLVFPRFHEAYLLGSPFPKNPGSAVPVIGQRIGFLLPGRSDHWWEVAVGVDPTPVSADLEEVLRVFGLPFLEHYPDTNALLEVLLGGEAPGLSHAHPQALAVLLCQRERSAEAADVLGAALAGSKVEGYRTGVRAFAAHLGLSLD